MVVKVLRKRQITLPRELCDALGISEGDYLEIRVVDGKAILRRLDPLELLEGILAPEKPVEGLAEEIDVERKASSR